MASNRPRRRQQGQEQQEAPKKGKGSLNNMEMLGIGFFCLAFILYGLSKCGAEPEVENLPVVDEQVVLVDSTESETSSEDAPIPLSEDNSNLPTRMVDTSSFVHKLYITTDSLRIRKEPQVGGELVGYLSYKEEVFDLGERTVLEKIRVSPTEVKTAPWVKIKTKEGKEGWAFGAYMQFYPLPEPVDVGENNNGNN